MTVVSLSLESNLLNRFDKIWESEGYQNRSEAFRGAIRNFIERYDILDNENKETETIIIFSYKDSKSVRDKLNQIQHVFMEFIKETLHRHIHENTCFELITLKGNNNELKPIINKIRSTREIETFHTFSVILDS